MNTKVKKLIIPRDLVERHPLTQAAKSQVSTHRQEIKAILNGQDQRLLALVGPCSLDDSGAIFEFATRIEAVSEEISKKVKVVIRANPLKPRTTTGWRGLESESVAEARSALTQLANAGFAVAIELLAPSQGQYYGDILSLQWIGARNVTDQNVRLQASSMPDVPTMSKNGIFGDMVTAAQAMLAVGSAHDNVPLLDEDGQFSLVDTPGGSPGGIILRGAQKEDGSLEHNINLESVLAAHKALADQGLAQIGSIVDASHGNGAGFSTGSKSAKGQYQAALAAIDLHKNPEARPYLRGLMCESLLYEGTVKDAPADDTYGYSRTDPTLDVDQTIDVLHRLAEV